MSLSTLIKSIQDIMRKDVGVDGDAQRISQICWLLFLKIFDDKEMEWELTISDYKSPLPEALRWSNWAKDDEGITGEELIDFVNNQLFPALKELATSANSSPRARVIGSVFADAYNYMKSGTLLRQVINVIEEDVDFNSSTDRHLFNDIYEKILADLQSAGNAGEYYTPRAVTQFIVDMIDPQLGESVLDPACGTGGFLTCAIDHLKKQETTVEDRNRLIENIHGVEKKPLPHMLAVTNMMLHDIDVPVRIRHDNTLARPFRDYGAKDRVDIIITNPPFGGVEEDGIEKNFLASHRTRETADLFMALIMHLLKPDIGRAAVVLPDGFLFGEGVKNTLKQELLENFNLHTIVRLPRGVFAPYTSINTNILFFEKGGPTTDIWFFEHPYPEGYKSYSRSKPLTIGEFDLEKAWWGGIGRKNRQVTEHAWKVSADEIIERNYNLDCKNPHQKRVEQSSPDELMSEYQNSNHNLLKAQNILKNKLLTTLTAHPVRQEMSQNNITLLKEHFDTVFSTSTGVTRLRELILILAMQGKLVEQNPSDQSANELLKDIKAEKQRLVDENKIRKQKPLPPVSEDEIPYELPESWEWVRLRDIGHDWGQKTPDNQFTYIDVGAIDNNIGKIVNPQTVEAAAAPSRARKIVHPGTIIYSTVRPYLLNIAVIEKEYAPEAIASTAFAIIHPFSGVSAQFVYRYLRSPFFVTYVESTQKGVAYPAINDGDFFSGTFPLPPLAEQLRIVAKIDELMILCDQLDTHIITCNEKQQALLNAVMSQF